MFHVTLGKGLAKFKDDGFFRGRYWSSKEKYLCPHEHLKKIEKTLPDGFSIFLFCFFTTYEKALEEMPTTSSWAKDINDNVYMIRFNGTLEDITSAGFSVCWDDCLKKGDAYLFWRIEPFNETRRSSCGIPKKMFSILEGSSWKPL